MITRVSTIASKQDHIQSQTTMPIPKTHTTHSHSASNLSHNSIQACSTTVRHRRPVLTVQKNGFKNPAFRVADRTGGSGLALCEFLEVAEDLGLFERCVDGAGWGRAGRAGNGAVRRGRQGSPVRTLVPCVCHGAGGTAVPLASAEVDCPRAVTISTQLMPSPDSKIRHLFLDILAWS